MVFPKAVLSFIAGPVRVEELDYGRVRVLTHLQKYSHFGFMLTFPFCFHFWCFYKLQSGSDQVGWVPGTERGAYFRFQPLTLIALFTPTLWTYRLLGAVLIAILVPAYRWDVQEGMRKTWGYFGFHWD